MTSNTSMSPFVVELDRMLAARSIPWRRLAELVGYHPSWLSKIRHGTPPSADLVRRCDEALEAAGKLIALAALKETRRPAQLPAPPAGFMGRQAELRRMHDTLLGGSGQTWSNVVVVHGPPGVGKTAVALRCAHELQRGDEKRFPDGELFVSLHGYSQKRRPVRPEDVLQDFLIALGISRWEIPAGEEQRAGLFRSVLAASRVLIVLDNALSSMQIESLLPAAPGCGVIVTSRNILARTAISSGAENIALGPVEKQDAVDILLAAIPGAAEKTQRAHLEALAEQCGGLPLALRIMAERLVVNADTLVEDLVSELAVERHRLDALATDDSYPIRTVFEWSYRDLSPEEGRMFRLLGLSPGSDFDAEAAAALAGVPVMEGRRQLEKLCSVHLVEAAPYGRYAFHDLLRVYAVDRAGEEETKDAIFAALHRLWQWYLLGTATHTLSVPSPRSG